MATSTGARRRQIVLRRYLYFLAALIGLAVALGSLSRSQAGGTWLANSYWILFVIDLLPVLALGGIVLIVIFLVWNLKDTSDAIGAGMARKRQQKKRLSTKARLFIYTISWALAIAVIWFKCGGIPCKASPPSVELRNLIFVDQSGPPNPAGQALGILLGASLTVSSIVQSTWFEWAFFGLVIVSSVVFVRAYKVALEEYRADLASLVMVPHQEGLKAVKEAIQIVQQSETGGPRERIMACYNRMLKGCYDLGANITPDQTARELETTIRRTLMINSKGLKVLTGLFEEARYSLHPMTEQESREAYSSLLMIESELSLDANKA